MLPEPGVNEQNGQQVADCQGGEVHGFGVPGDKATPLRDAAAGKSMKSPANTPKRGGQLIFSYAGTVNPPFHKIMTQFGPDLGSLADVVTGRFGSIALDRDL